MVRKITDILREEGLIDRDGRMHYIIEKDGCRQVRTITPLVDWKVHTEVSQIPLWKGLRVGMSYCLSPYEQSVPMIVEKTKKKVFLGILQGLLIEIVYPKDGIVHIWTEERNEFTYVYGAIAI